MTQTSDLPPSLAVVPNIPLHEQTLEQLQAERDYWQKAANEADSWGAAFMYALKLVDACDAWIARHETM